MKMTAKIACGILILTAASMAYAAIKYSTGTVTQVYTYGDYGGGDFTFRLSSQPPECAHGYWISKSQPGFATSVATVLQAKATGETLNAGGHDTLIWTGSSGLYCKLDYVGFP